MTTTTPDSSRPSPTPSPSREIPAFDLEFPCIDGRERALPIRQGDLTRLLLAEPGLTGKQRAHLGHLARLLGVTFHSEFYDKQRELKELYAPLDPDSDYVDVPHHSAPLKDRSDEDFLVPFEEALRRANYRRLEAKVIEQAVSAPNEIGLTYVPDFGLFEHIIVYVRGYTQVIRDCRSASTRYRKRRVALDAYQRLVLALKFKPGLDLGPAVRDDVLYLRMFKDVPHVDMEMHLPEQGTKVRMRWIDKAQIASPMVIAIATKLIAAAISPIALTALIVAPIGAGVNSFFGFHRAKKQHLYQMIHKLYYLTLANNASVVNRLIDTAEDEEYKEAMLAYFILWRAQLRSQPPRWDVARLDVEIERFLEEKVGVVIDFEVADALAKLVRLGLARADDHGALRATPIRDALRALDQNWVDSINFDDDDQCSTNIG